MSRLPPIVAFAAPSGTGKTTLVEAVVRVLVARGKRVGVLKSDAHRVVLDTPGKDSWRFGEAGAASVAVLSHARMALFARLDGEVSIVHAVDRLFPHVDIVLAEGFRRSGLPSIRVHRTDGPSDEGWDPPQNPVAWASDGTPDTHLPVLPLGDPARVADWILEHYGEVAAPRRLTVVLPVAGAEGGTSARVAAERIGGLLGAPVMAVVAPGATVPAQAGLRIVPDLRPNLGLLGAVFTGLAAADTPEILVVSPRYYQAPADLLRGLAGAGPRRADLVHLEIGGHPEPGLALYGHRCLSSIQAALLSGELKLTGWWGQVRRHAVDPATWERWDPEGLVTR